MIAYRRQADTTAGQPAEDLLIAVNFSDQATDVWLPFPARGQWNELIDANAHIDNTHDGAWIPVHVPSNYGVIYEHA